MDRAVFLDRDGVVIENRENYVRSWSDVEVYPQALAALARIAELGYKVVFVTNQSAIGRGMISYETAQEINQRLIHVIKDAGGRVDGFFMCPHAPGDDCPCRKPKPGLILQAAEALSLDLEHSIMIGDALTDVQAGQAAGVGQTVLLCTGRGSSEFNNPAAALLKPFQVYETLSEALDDLVPGEIKHTKG